VPQELANSQKLNEEKVPLLTKQTLMWCQCPKALQFAQEALESWGEVLGDNGSELH
jgi:hypothetical protein